tara:strand:+ start:21110 stop:22252 length:1143 start_codon:yes stop_codon:yes gene_type:complete
MTKYQQIIKVLRYFRLFGISRTLYKIYLLSHNKSSEQFKGDILISNSKNKSYSSVAIIGCGSFAFSNICFFLYKSDRRSLRYAFDIDKAKALNLCKTYNGYAAISNFEYIINDDKVKIVYIASNHSSHAEYAIKCLNKNKSVHIEKPHAVNEDQLKQLISAAKKSSGNLFLGFNRPKSKMAKDVIKKLDSADGSISMSFFVVGHKLDIGHWYFSTKEGGRVLGNLCHWTDLSLHLINRKENAFPCKIKSISGDDPNSNFVVSTVFNDGSLVTFNFSAKGYSFEGVREFIQIHKGELLIHLRDFQKLEGWKMNKVFKTNLFFRNQGHEANILNSYYGIDKINGGEDLQYVYDTGYFMLKVKESIETGDEVICNPIKIKNIQ